MREAGWSEQIRHRRSAAVVLVTSGLVLAAGCASTPPPVLQDARYAYQRASVGPAAETAVPELEQARRALDRANRAFRENADAALTRTYAYVALRKAEEAEVRARTVLARQLEAAAEAQLAAVTREQRERTERQLAEARAQLAEAERLRAEARQHEEQVEEQRRRDLEERTRLEEEARRTEEQRRVEAQQRELAATQEELRRKESELEAERTARREYEARVAAAAEAERRARAEADERAREAAEALERLDAVSVKEDERGTVITLSGTVLFESGKATLLPGAKRRLDEVAAALAQTDNRLLIEGHTDSQGPAAANEALSLRRAEAVHEYLVSRGVADQRIRAVGRGEDDPVADNRTPEGRANNRRVEIVLEREN